MVPLQNFIIKCSKCRWYVVTTGLSEDLKHLKEVEGCSNCGKPRVFKCPECGQNSKMMRLRGNT
jgi:hypothetical protein